MHAISEESGVFGGWTAYTAEDPARWHGYDDRKHHHTDILRTLEAPFSLNQDLDGTQDDKTVVFVKDKLTFVSMKEERASVHLSRSIFLATKSPKPDIHGPRRWCSQWCLHAKFGARFLLISPNTWRSCYM